MVKKSSRSSRTRRSKHAPAKAARRPARPVSRRAGHPADEPAPFDTSPSDDGAADSGFSIVAVGASAGGLETFSEVLGHLTPPKNVAIVFVQHLSPGHASNLTELVANKTTLEVVTAANRMRIEAGHIYVMPPSVHMEVLDGAIHLLPRPTDRSQFTPIDFFMQSLARWARSRAIGVILSGTASDGAAGIREIKALGGITIAQAPQTAKYEGMPRAAIATGMIDLVLSPAEIADRLAHVGRHPYLLGAGDGTTQELDDDQLKQLFGLLRRASGVDFTQYKTPTIRRRLLRRMALLRLTDIDAYLRYLADMPAETKALSQDLLIHVTRFFREPESFDALATHVFSEWVSDRGEEPIRIWVPGCATGEEAYSIGMRLLEAFGDRALDRRIQIFATDVSEAAVEHARAGLYPIAISADVSPERLKRFFTRTDGSYRVIKALRDMCVFARHDLTRDPPFSRLDLVVCRNVLIYLDATVQKRLMSIFHYALKARGFLLLGPAETPGAHGFFSVIDKKCRLFRKTAADGALPMALPIDVSPGGHAPLAQARFPMRGEGKTVQDEATRLILDRYGPPGVIVDAAQQIVQFRGHTGRYLEAASGEPNLSILKMARGGLLHPLRTMLQQAKRRSRIVRREGVHIQRNGDWAEITLEVVPLATSRGQFYLVLFEEMEARPGRRKPPASRVVERESNARVADLRRELAASREYLQSVIQELEAANEELQSANEEVLSSNEELQSTNEELDTAKEELQSTNEELNTVNDELRSRNEELTRINSDLVNLLSNVEIPIVMVDGSLAIRRFTPRAEQLFNLIPGDVGRPIGQINPNFSGEDLEALIRETVETISPREREVQDRSGRWLSLRLRPYKGVDNRLDGAMLSVIDIDASKRYQAVVERTRDHFRSIVEAARHPMAVLDTHARITTANRAFCRTFRISPDDAEGRELGRIADGNWDSRVALGLIADVRKNGKTVERTIDQELPDVGRRKVRITADPLPLVDGPPGFVVTIEDLGREKPQP
jgi:two-component system CheB/CheR fusion protein